MKRLLRHSLLVALLVALSAPVLAQAQSPTGRWQTIDDKTGEPRSIVEIYEGDDGQLYGKVVEIVQASDDAKRNDEGQIICSACEGKKHNQPIEGMVILEGLEKDGDEWDGGTILDPENGKTYKAKISLDGEDKLNVRGYIGVALFGRTQTWHRASS